jgi:hypothetical protein
MALEEMELDVGGTKIKGVWIAILFTFASTIGGGIWTASEFFSRLATLEETVQESLQISQTTNVRFDDLKTQIDDDIKAAEVELGKVMQELEDNDVAGLQGKLATLGTNLETIMARQQELIAIQERVVQVEKQITETATLVQKAEVMMKDADLIQTKLEKIQREIDDIWEGMDYLANPYGS